MCRVATEPDPVEIVVSLEDLPNDDVEGLPPDGDNSELFDAEIYPEVPAEDEPSEPS